MSENIWRLACILLKLISRLAEQHHPAVLTSRHSLLTDENMVTENLSYYLDTLFTLIPDGRFQLFLLIVVLINWSFRHPRPMKISGNKAIFITGCDTGIGYNMARHFDKMKTFVFAGCLYPEGKGAKSLKETCSKRLQIVPLDITKEDQIKEAAEYVKANLPQEVKGLHCLINSAGVLPYTNFELMTTEMCEEAININLMGAIRMTKYFLPLISEANGGRIVNIGSILARLTFPNTSLYCATKLGLDGFSSCLRHELQKQGIYVTVVEPGDLSKTTDIMQWTEKKLKEIWKDLSSEEKKAKGHLYEEAKKKISVQKVSKEQEEYNHKLFLQDVEDAVLAEEPHWRYISAPLSTRIFLWFLRLLPGELSCKLVSVKSTK